MSEIAVPFPVATLLRRARNAKSPRDRHDTAYFAWEVSAKLLAASRLAEDPRPIATGAVGDWVKAARREEGAQLRSDDVLAAHAHLRRATSGEQPGAQSVSAARLLEALAPYRNQYVGHGTVLREHGFYDDGAGKLLAGLAAAWDEGAFLSAGERVVWVESVEKDPDGSLRARVFELGAEGPRLLPIAQAAPLAKDALPSRVSLWDECGGRLRPLHPLVAFDGENERVYLFNGTSRRAEYLDFAGGKRLAGKALDERFPGLPAALFAAFREGPVAAPEEPRPDDARRFGDFRILGKLGEGGMGEVYLAVQESLDRVVALKVIRTAQAEDAVARGRFQREIRALSRCDHANVVKILTSGRERGVLWYAMEYVEGADLSLVARELTSSNDLDTAVSSAMDAALTERCALFADAPAVERARPAVTERRGDKVRQLGEAMRDAARGVAHLHERGILHRDLKPANLMLTPDRRVIVMDLGLAQLKDATSSLTKDKAKVLGTLRYMPPEQLQRSLLEIDERADVYALGATFYEFFGERPFLDGDTEARLMAQVLHEEPLALRRANRGLPRDIAAIVHKATAKDPRLRYTGAAAVADDVQAWLDGRPVSAREPSFGYYVALAVKKNKPLAAAVVGLVATLAAGLWVSLGALGRAETAAGQEREARQLAQAESTAKDEALRRARVLGLAGAAVRELDRHPMRALLLAREAARIDANRDSTDALRRALTVAQERALFAGHEKAIHWACLSRDGARVLTASCDGTARIWDRDGNEVAVLAGHDDCVQSASFSPDGTRVATGSKDKTARLWDLHGRELARCSGHDSTVFWTAFSPDGSRIMTCSSDGTARLWDLAGNPVSVLRQTTGRILGVAFSPDGSQIVSTADDGTARLWDRAGRETSLLPGPHDAALWFPSFSSDGTRIVAGAEDQTVRVWDLASNAGFVLRGHGEGFVMGAFSADGRRLVTTSADRAARLWDQDGRLLQVSLGHENEITWAACSPDGTRIATASKDGTARIWDANGAPRSVLRGHAGGVFPVAFTGDGKAVLTGSADGTARLWACEGAEVAVLRGHTDWVHSAIFSPDSTKVATGGGDGTLRVWNLDGDQVAEMRGHEMWTWWVAWSPDGTRLVSASGDQTARIWDVRGKQLAVLRGHDTKVRSATFSPDGTQILTHGDDAVARLWDGEGRELAQLRGHEKGLTWSRFSPDGRVVATASADNTARLWDLGGKPLARLVGHTDQVLFVDVSADGSRLVTASTDQTARLWDAGGNELGVMRGHTADVRSAVFSPDGGQILTASEDATARLWDLTGKELVILGSHLNGVHEALFAPDGTTILTTSRDKTARLWDRAGQELAVLLGHDDVVGRSPSFSPDGTMVATPSTDRTARIWLTRSGDLVALANRRLKHRKFTRSELLPYRDLVGEERLRELASDGR